MLMVLSGCGCMIVLPPGWYDDDPCDLISADYFWLVSQGLVTEFLCWLVLWLAATAVLW